MANRIGLHCVKGTDSEQACFSTAMCYQQYCTPRIIPTIVIQTEQEITNSTKVVKLTMRCSVFRIKVDAKIDRKRMKAFIISKTLA